MTIPAQITEQLIALGNVAPDELDKADIGLLKDHDWINRTGRDPWAAAAGGLTTQDVIRLIKGLVVTEYRLSWMGGSVAAAIWVFHELQSRDRLLAAEVADWVLARTRNPYLPFGRQNHGARSLEELQRLDGKYEARRSARWERNLTEQAQSAAKAAIRREERARSNEVHAQRHALAAQVRRRLIEEFAPRSAGARLEAVASDAVRPLDFYPEAWAALTSEEIGGLSANTRELMLIKLSDRRKGPWRALYLALRSADGMHSDG